MAKIRVFELARLLNMKNKALISKLKEMNIEVMSHLSRLDEDIVTHIKANLFSQNAHDTSFKNNQEYTSSQNESVQHLEAVFNDSEESLHYEISELNEQKRQLNYEIANLKIQLNELGFEIERKNKAFDEINNFHQKPVDDLPDFMKGN